MEKKEKINWQGFNVIAGPCTIDTYDSLYETASEVSRLGIKLLRGGAYKMRTSVHSFRGLGDIAVQYLAAVGKEFGMHTVSEVIEIENIDYMAQHLDILMVGTRNMQNYPLLERLGKVPNPVILKRGFAATYDEWLSAAEHIIENGNPYVILCERGIRTFEPETRFTLDVSAIKVMQIKSGLPVIVDPSHAAGNRGLVPSLALAAVAAGANGLMIESMPQPSKSICDAAQTIDTIVLGQLLNTAFEIRKINKDL